MLLFIFDSLFSYYAKVSSLPFIIQICTVFILLCIILFSIFFVIIAYIRFKHNKKTHREEKLGPVIDELILKYLLEDANNYSLQDVNTDFEKQVGTLNQSILDMIIQRLILYKNNFDLNVSEQFYKIITALRIENHLGKKFNFSTSFTKMEGIQSLSSLSITAAESNIFPFTYSSNKIIRNEARNSYIRLSKNEPFKFFDEAQEKINLWDQIKLMKYLMELENNEIPKFSKWVTYSENETIVDFSIKMCSYFKQYESIPVLIDFLKTNNHQLREEAIKTLGELKATESETLLKNIFLNQPDNCQKEIIKTIGKFNTGQSIDFLQNTFETAISTDTKKVAADAIYNYEYKGKEIYNSLIQKNKGFNNLILQHISNPLIKFK